MRRLLVALLALFFAIQVASLVKYVNGQVARYKAEGWLDKAKQDAKPDMTKDDAVRWLKQHGADSLSEGKTAWDNGQEVDWHSVEGFRKMSDKSLWTKQMTANLTFQFDTKWHFTKVVLSIWVTGENSFPYHDPEEKCPGASGCLMLYPRHLHF